MYTVNETYKNIEAEFKPRSKWGHGVKDTALALLDSLDMPENGSSRPLRIASRAVAKRRGQLAGIQLRRVRSRVQRGYRRPVLHPVRIAPVHG